MDLICSRIDFHLTETLSIAGPPRSGKTTFARHLIEDAELAGARGIVATLNDEYQDHERFRDLSSAIDACDETDEPALLIVDGAQLTADERALDTLRTLASERPDTAVVVIAQRAPYAQEWLANEDHQLICGYQATTPEVAFSRMWDAGAPENHDALHRHHRTWGSSVSPLTLP